jgi:hypothetical protein
VNESPFFLPGLPADLILKAYQSAPGNEIESGKFVNPESSAALVANTFGLFIDNAPMLPALPGTEDCGWPAESMELEKIVRFPWAGGSHPCLDVLIVTGGALIGVESKRYEPFRPKTESDWSEAYWRPVWGDHMEGYKGCRDRLGNDRRMFASFDAAQLVKHAFALRTAVHHVPAWAGKRPVLFYLYAEPEYWIADKKPVSIEDRVKHRTDRAVQRSKLRAGAARFAWCDFSLFPTKSL